MHRRLPAVAAAILLAAVLAASANAQFPEIRTPDQEFADADRYRAGLVGTTPFIAPDGSIRLGTRCATHGMTPAEHALANERGVAMRELVDLRANLTADELAAGKNTVRIHFHVIHDGDEGNVSSADLREQMRVLNRAIRKHGFKFRRKGTTRTDNAEWHSGCASGDITRDITDALAVDPTKNLNVYLCNPGGGLLGWATLAGSASAGTSRDGIFALYSTLPNGTAVPFHLGYTVVHEVGHYLGLLHTFQGGCSGNGDFVDDTPPQATSTSGCPTGADTCVGDGPDPIDNFMDYSDDPCMERFTKGQAQRMKEQVAAHRPLI